MCGFCGFTGNVLDRDAYIKEMARLITHRGPDSEGYYLDDGIAMGFRRLSIIDIESANQPLYNEDKSLVLMFNGEIYNYRQLRDELLAAGFTDSFRCLHPADTGMYSWWSMRFRARERNAGWRIDYFLVSSRLADKIEKAEILMDVMGSDHCPVELDLTL